MTRSHNIPTIVALVAALSLVLVPMTTVADHNSLGGNFHIVQADEVDSNGDLQADVPNGTSPYDIDYHTHLTPPRGSPADQTGDRYTDCTPADEVSGSYEDALLDGDACYVGLLDQQFEYVLATSPLITHLPLDPLYVVNPAPDDDHCRGDGDLVESVQRRANDAECQLNGDSVFYPGQLAVDINLLTDPLATTEGDELTNTADRGSGYNTLPLIMTPYVFLFGQPHPENPNPSELEAGEGPFGSDPANGGGPVSDLGGACGDRTQDCVLLTPEDIKRYDDKGGNLANVGNFARVCQFAPQFTLVTPPDERAQGLCGEFGSLFDTFQGNAEEGGLGIPGVPATWYNLKPGWYGSTLTLNQGEPGQYTADAADEPTTADPAYTEAFYYHMAVNPAVPTGDHPLDCVRPNMLASGDKDIAGGVDDPGFYGTYIADAIDTDAYVAAFSNQYDAYIDTTRPLVRPLVEQVNAISGDAQDAANQLIDDTLEQVPGIPPEVVEALNDGIDRASPLETGEDPTLVSFFTRTQQEGIRCDAQGVPQVFTEDADVDGDLVFDVDLQQATVSLKDYTLLDGQLPAGESQTEEGGWMADQYTFSGDILGFLDTSQDATGGDGVAEFSGCASATGQPQPNNDFCGWQALWDGYNPDCTDNNANECGDILTGNGYDTETGVGLTAVWKISGPIVVTDEDLARPNEITERSGVFGLNDPTAQHCIVAYSVGFSEKDVAPEPSDLCEGTTGEQVVIADGFNDQSGTTRGGFSAAFNVLKLTPTPSAVVQATDIGVGDEVCVTGIWNVLDEGDGIADDTKGTVELEAGSNTFSACQPMESTLKA